jgi:hypothetical protein
VPRQWGWLLPQLPELTRPCKTQKPQAPSPRLPSRLQRFYQLLGYISTCWTHFGIAPRAASNRPCIVTCHPHQHNSHPSRILLDPRFLFIQVACTPWQGIYLACRFISVPPSLSYTYLLQIGFESQYFGALVPTNCDHVLCIYSCPFPTITRHHGCTGPRLGCALPYPEPSW